MEPIVEVSLPLRSECKCFCHNGGFTHVAPCCRNDPTSSPDLKADNAALVEVLGEALFGLSAKMVGADFLKDDANHAAYERVVHAFRALQATEPRP
jgi:hypothetical protein